MKDFTQCKRDNASAFAYVPVFTYSEGGISFTLGVNPLVHDGLAKLLCGKLYKNYTNLSKIRMCFPKISR